MKKTLFALSAIALLSTTPSYAFDLSSIVTQAVKESVTEVVKDTTKEATKEVVQSAAQSAGLEGSSQYIGAAIDNADSIQNGAAGFQAGAGAIGAGGLTGASAALSTAAIAAEQHKKLSSNTSSTPREQYQAEYQKISAAMGQCGTDNQCIIKYQQQLIDLQKQGNNYVAQTGDADYNGQVNDMDTQVDNTNSLINNLKMKPASSASFN